MSRVVAVVGAGPVGRALATGLQRVGHEVTLAVREPDASTHDEYRHHFALATVEDAVKGAEAVVLAIPAANLPDAVPRLPLVAGQVVIDATNALGATLPGDTDSPASYIAATVPTEVSVVKAFNTIGAEHLADGGLGDHRAFLPVAGDDAGRPLAVELATDLGFAVADLGSIEAASMVEDHARLWIHLALRRGWGRDFGFIAFNGATNDERNGS